MILTTKSHDRGLERDPGGRCYSTLVFDNLGH